MRHLISYWFYAMVSYGSHCTCDPCRVGEELMVVTKKKVKVGPVRPGQKKTRRLPGGGKIEVEVERPKKK